MAFIDTGRKGGKIEVRKASGVTISKCTCDHSYQDKLYGKGMRVKNNRPGNNPPRCSVCGK